VAEKPRHPKRRKEPLPTKRHFRFDRPPLVSIRRLAYSPDGQRLLVEYRVADGRQIESDRLKRLAVWDARTGAEVWTVREPDLVTHAFWVSGKRHILLVDWDDRLSVWDADRGAPSPQAEPVLSFGEESEGDVILDVSADGRRALAWGKRGTRVWDVATGKVVAYLNCQHGVGSHGSLSRDGRVALIHFGPYLNSEHSAVWDVDGGSLRRLWKKDSPWTPGGILPDGKRLVGAYVEPRDIAHLSIRTLDGDTDLAEWNSKDLFTATCTPDGRALLHLTSEGLVRVDLNTGKAETTWMGDLRGLVRHPRPELIAFSPDGTRLLTADGHAANGRGDCSIRVEEWDATKWERLKTLAEVKKPD
jgi:WD40 repeat protein